MRKNAIEAIRRAGTGGGAMVLALVLIGCGGGGGRGASAYDDTSSLPRAAPAYDGSDVVATPGRAAGPSALEQTGQTTTPTIRQQDNLRRGGTITGGSNAPAPGGAAIRR